MRLKIVGILLGFCICLPLYAKKDKPVPDSVIAAKAIYVINETDSQSVGDSAYDELDKWGKFKVTHDRKSADLIVHFFQSTHTLNGNSHAIVSMYVTTADSDDRLYQAPVPFKLTLGGVIRGEIEDFRKWVERK